MAKVSFASANAAPVIASHEASSQCEVRSAARMSAIDRMRIDGLSRAVTKPQLCQYRSASTSIARTTMAAANNLRARYAAPKEIGDQHGADPAPLMAAVDRNLPD